MKSIIIYLAIALFISLLTGHPSFTLSPFSFKIRKPVFAIGMVLFVSGLTCMLYSRYNEGYKKGSSDVIEYLENKMEAGREAGEK